MLFGECAFVTVNRDFQALSALITRSGNVDGLAEMNLRQHENQGQQGSPPGRSQRAEEFHGKLSMTQRTQSTMRQSSRKMHWTAKQCIET